MNKSLKALILGLALCLLGAIPASASASGSLFSGASEVSVGTQITGKGLNNPAFYAGESVFFECTGARLTGTVASNKAENSETSVESLRLTGNGAEEKCQTGSGNVAITLDTPACMRWSKTAGWMIRGNACLTSAGVPRLTFVYSIIGSPTCHYRGAQTNSLSFTSNVNSEPLVLSQTEAGALFILETPSSALCASQLTLKRLNLELTTAGGKGLKLVS